MKLTPYLKRLACSLLMVCPMAQADELENPLPDDLAYGAQINLSHQLPLQSVILPAAVYHQQASETGADLRVFNADGIAVPMDRQVLEKVEKEPTREPLSLFPLMANQLEDTAGLQLAINRESGRTEIQLSDNTDQVKTGETLVAYVIALPENWLKAKRNQLRGLAFSWDTPQQGFIEGLRIETSADLLHWKPWIENESLSRLTWQGQQIGKTDVDISRSQRRKAKRYWRISWQQDQEVEFQGVEAILQDRLLKDDQQWSSLDNRWQVAEDEKSVIEFSNQTQLPVTGLTLQPNSDNGFMSGRVLSRDDERDHWRWRGDLIQYTLQFDEGKTIASEALDFTSVRDRFWRIELDSGVTAEQLKQWRMQMAWTPGRLTFVREGREPYLLAWGNPQVSYSNSDLKDLYKALTPKQQRQFLERPARTNRFRELGGEIKLQPPLPFGWKQVALWASLILGVIVLFWMARGLYRQMADAQQG
ncbi:DUF3999 domain-containing protein [Maricurvus nonylphenolicus]|uniref:DUF3999 family protein n=1 Tax=Maricurvus nonylphenolicus TaxID=1008307 RepID=UPI0036F447B5